MIITCINCLKKFEVDSTLIPESGRNIQCGSCNITWFYKQEIIDSSNKINNNGLNELSLLYSEDEIVINSDQTSNQKQKTLNEKNKPKLEIIDKNIKFQNIRRNPLTKLLSYLIVIIVSFVAVIIVLDTFKVFLSGSFPQLELILFNLFETLKDILLFTKNLFF